MHARGQTSIEVLLVFSFVILVVLAIVTPYVENQNKTNAAYVAKLSILPFVEKNNLRVKINEVTPEVVPGNVMLLHIRTNGNWDRYVDEELNLGVNSHPPGCIQVCDAVAALGVYASVELDWLHAGNPYCIDPFTGGNTAC